MTVEVLEVTNSGAGQSLQRHIARSRAVFALRNAARHQSRDELRKASSWAARPLTVIATCLARRHHVITGNPARKLSTGTQRVLTQ